MGDKQAHEPAPDDARLDDTLELSDPGAFARAERVERPERVGGRYELHERLGEGSYGQVFSGRDLLLDAPVAVKFFSNLEGSTLPRIRRELVALRLLRHPGVVRPLDDGIHNGRPYLVMEHVDGSLFPGENRTTWARLRVPAMSLLETLARVHAAGVVHRDLKPGNVLVSTDGKATLLDFGLARGAAVGSDITREGAVVGTPAYLAPELLTGSRGDARSDLYAVGVMLFTALGGEPPHPFSTVNELLHRRLSSPAPRLVPTGSDVPAEVIRVVDQLLARDPADRPDCAEVVLGVLAGELGITTSSLWIPPILPRAEVLAQLLTAAIQPGLVQLVGEEGAGRSTLVRALAYKRFPGRRAVSLEAGEAAFSTLSAGLGGVAPPSSADLDEARDWFARRIEPWVQDAVLLGDGARSWDKWSSDLLGLHSHRLTGVIDAHVWTRPDERLFPVPPLTANEAHGFFEGANRIFHEVEDAAEELLRHSGGNPRRVAWELTRWKRSGLARVTPGGGLTLERSSLERLRAGTPLAPPPIRPNAGRLASHEQLLGILALAWPYATCGLLAKVTERPRWVLEAELARLAHDGRVVRRGDTYEPAVAEDLAAWSEEERKEVHHRLSVHLRPSSRERLVHLLAAEAPTAEIVAAATSQANRAADTGRSADALSIAETALIALRDSDDTPLDDLLAAMVHAAFLSGTEHALEVAHYHLGRCGSGATEAIAALTEFVALAIQAHRPGGEGIEERLSRLPEMQDRALELWRQGSRFVAVRAAAHDVQATLLDELTLWSQGLGEREVGAVMSWRGSFLYRVGQFRQAAEHHQQAAKLRPNPASALGSTLNAASALLEAGAIAACGETAEAARGQASALRHPLLEARAEWLIRLAQYRAGSPMAPDRELVTLVERVGSASLFGSVALTEAAFAWRAGELETGAKLARRSARACGAQRRGTVEALALALALLCTRRDERDEDTLGAALETGVDCRSTELAAQILGLLCLCGYDDARGPLLDLLPADTAAPRQRLDILSLAECRAAALDPDQGP